MKLVKYITTLVAVVHIMRAKVYSIIIHRRMSAGRPNPSRLRHLNADRGWKTDCMECLTVVRVRGARAGLMHSETSALWSNPLSYSSFGKTVQVSCRTPGNAGEGMEKSSPLIRSREALVTIGDYVYTYLSSDTRCKSSVKHMFHIEAAGIKPLLLCHLCSKRFSLC